MSDDIVDDLHAAEDRIGALEIVLGNLLDSLPAHWHDNVVDEARTVLDDRYERPSCDEDCDREICGSPRHYNQTFNLNLGVWEDDDECPAGGEHTPVPDSDENDDMRTFSSKTFHCAECGINLPSPEREP